MSYAPEKSTLTANAATKVFSSEKNHGRLAIHASGDFDSGNVIFGYLTEPGTASSFVEFGASGDSTLTAAGSLDLKCGERFDIYATTSGSSPAIIVLVSNV